LLDFNKKTSSGSLEVFFIYENYNYGVLSIKIPQFQSLISPKLVND
jgi:hypothetical protein